MAVDIIYHQKNELERLLNKKYILRENLIAGEKALKNDLIKVIIGPRRAGKSTYCLEILQSKNFAYLNFDNEDILNIGSHEKIISLLEEVYSNSKIYFLDEIQNLPKWELFVNTLQRRGFNVILTGSNANLLSGELATHLTGRYEEITVYPFSFKEYITAKNGDEHLLLDYLQTGGYPEIVVNNIDSKNYLSTLVEAVIFKDIVKRYKVRYSSELDGLVKMIFSGFTKPVSVTNLGKNIGIGSHHTVNKYLGYLHKVYLVMFLDRFSYKAKERVKLAKKAYFVDNGFASINFSASPDFGKLMENMVFMHYLRAKKSIFYYQTKSGKEVDFVVKSGMNISSLVQVCWDLDSGKTKKREISALNEAGIELKCQDKIIITKQNLSDFLLDKEI